MTGQERDFVARSARDDQLARRTIHRLRSRSREEDAPQTLRGGGLPAALEQSGCGMHDLGEMARYSWQPAAATGYEKRESD